MDSNIFGGEILESATDSSEITIEIEVRDLRDKKAIIMEGKYGLYRQRRTSMRNEEFQEEDVWAVFQERKDFTSKSKFGSSESLTITPRRLPTASRMIPRAATTIAGATTTTQEPKILQQSAPVNIPDWSKIYGKNLKQIFDDDGHEDSGGGGGGSSGDRGLQSSWDSDDGDDDDYGGTIVPPHEWIARRLARSQITSFSVCEGVGRTLKGRDLSRVRNAVLTRTGFLEQYGLDDHDQNYHDVYEIVVWALFYKSNARNTKWTAR
ncbi:hypothetical protein HYC85_013230 [Camellia sinensis]|uniref:Uncharacterized protein n=1 Tax=Camellia sinensis TaxID=4442 RepID=A0A7J7H2T3_CAMSI|nr:hypothetical protein HYC85_013230 [Camellia sinensis]